MLNRLISLAVLLCAVGGMTPSSLGDNVLLQLFPFTGESRLVNSNPAPFSFIFYSLSSNGGALNPNAAVWKSITDVYDVSGNGYIDPTNNWLKFSASSTQLTEGVFLNPGGTLPAYRAVSFGNVWNKNATITPDVTAQITQANQLAATVNIVFDIDGDYNDDDMVDQLDFDLWKISFGQSGTPFALLADGNLNGVVDAADYTIWRNNLGKNLASLGLASASGGPAVGLGQGSVVPEPASVVLLLSAAGFFALSRRSPRL